MKSSTKRERLLEWIYSGDPNDVPVLMGPGFELAASYLGKDESEVTWREAIDAAEKTGTHSIACTYSPLPFDAVPFIDDIEMRERRESLPDGTPRLTKEIVTPEGTLREVQEFPKDKGSYHREFFVKGEDDIPAFACFIRKTTSAVVENPAIRRKVSEKIEAVKNEIAGAFPLDLLSWCRADIILLHGSGDGDLLAVRPLGCTGRIDGLSLEDDSGLAATRCR
ncbi:MAG: hypothetical protein ACYC4F_01430 [Armatimonadota bacterium]